ncbi:HalOD1 output domain-containing protein [Salinigranum marinum]|uniref:HalOD1 output domain-containing protein n=1 Tax=Salinigranum marinum TaxID=1515595 RepID=UPI002989FB79|nr:HalOD1 output domain-containing protein [Salinigranum marinum]
MTFETEFDPDETSVCVAVATATDTDPLELPPLYGRVDVGVAERLVPRERNVTVRFPYFGRSVVVVGPGHVVVSGPFR